MKYLADRHHISRGTLHTEKHSLTRTQPQAGLIEIFNDRRMHRFEVFSPPRPGTPGRGGWGGEGRKTFNTQEIIAISMLSAPHPQPFSPEYRGEGSQCLFVF